MLKLLIKEISCCSECPYCDDVSQINYCTHPKSTKSSNLGEEYMCLQDDEGIKKRVHPDCVLEGSENRIIMEEINCCVVCAYFMASPARGVPCSCSDSPDCDYGDLDLLYDRVHSSCPLPDVLPKENQNE